MTTNIMNISKQNISGDCILKCAYSFKYQNSNCVATNNGNSISLTYDKTSVSPVTYNNKKYEVKQIQIYSPSLHFFDGLPRSAEIMVSHIPVMGGKPLNVCVPIVQLSDSTTATILLSEIIEAVSTGAPAQGETTNISLQNFTLDNIIPKKPFFSYTSQLGDWIVFGKENAISLSADILAKLSTIIVAYPFKLVEGPAIFYNPDGASVSNGDGQIYIDCQPTGSSEEETDVTKMKPATTMNINTGLLKTILGYFLSMLLFIVILFLLHMGLQYIGSGKISGLPKFKTS